MDLFLPKMPTSAIDGLSNNLRAFWQVWADARTAAGGEIPKRRDIKVSNLKRLTSNCFVLEREPDSREFIFRMAGTGLDTVFDRNVTQESASEAVKPEAAESLGRFLNALVDAPCAGYARDTITTKTGKKVRTDSLSVPLLNADGECTIVMCYSDIEGVGFNVNVETVERTRSDYREMEEAYFIDLA
jgi:hypothetical protein